MKDLQEALEKMSNNPNGQIGEYWKFISTGKNFVKGKIYKQIESSINKYFAFSNGTKVDGYYPDNNKFFVKATKQEIFKHFNVTGFKVPMNLYGCLIKQGDIVRINNFSEQTNSYIVGIRQIPKEIVESWEPVIEEEQFKAGDYVMYHTTFAKIQDNNTLLLINDEEMNIPDVNIRKATPEEIQENTMMKVIGYRTKITKSSICIGCQEFTLEHLESLRFLLSRDVSISLSIDRIGINLSLVNKAIFLIKTN